MLHPCLQAEKAEKQRLEALLRDLIEIGKSQEAHDLLLQVMAWEMVSIPSAFIQWGVCILAACAEITAGCLSALSLLVMCEHDGPSLAP